MRADTTHRYDAHPMAILTSALAYLGSYYSEANPSLQGPSIHSFLFVTMLTAFKDKRYLRKEIKTLYPLWTSKFTD